MPEKDKTPLDIGSATPPTDVDPTTLLAGANPPAQPKKGKAAKTRIMIPSQTGPGGSDDVFLSVNGRDYLIKRDAEVDVPPAVLEALKHAVITDYVTDADGRIVRERQVPRFPFQVL